MKIGIVSPYYMNSYGGVQTLILNMQQFLKARGHTVIIIAPKPRDKDSQTFKNQDIVVLGNSVNINFKNPFRTTFPIAASDSRTISNFLEQEQFDVLNIHEPWMPLLPYQILQGATCPIVATTHARWPQSWFNKSLEKVRTPYFRLVLSKLDSLTAVSTVSAYNATLVDNNLEVQIIPNGIDLQAYKKTIRRLRKPVVKPYFLYLNRLEKRKGPRLLLRAYNYYVKNIASDPLPLIFAGNGPQMQLLKIETQLYGLTDLVSFEGYVSNDRKMELFANARVYVTPAPYGESFGIVLLESMAANLPFVAGDNEGYRCVARDQAISSLVNPQQFTKFAQKLHNLASNEGLRQQWLQWSQEAIAQYDYPLIIDKYEDCFQRVLKN